MRRGRANAAALLVGDVGRGYARQDPPWAVLENVIPPLGWTQAGELRATGWNALPLLASREVVHR